MTGKPYIVGIVVSVAVLFFAYTGGYHSSTSFFAGIIATSYLAYSSVAYAVTCVGSTPKRKAWVFFACGCAVLFAYLPSLRSIVELFYVESRAEEMRPIREIFMLSPMFVGSLCIYRAFVLWSEVRPKQPQNQAPDRTAPSVTSPAGQEPRH